MSYSTAILRVPEVAMARIVARGTEAVPNGRPST